MASLVKPPALILLASLPFNDDVLSNLCFGVFDESAQAVGTDVAIVSPLGFSAGMVWNMWQLSLIRHAGA